MSTLCVPCCARCVASTCCSVAWADATLAALGAAGCSSCRLLERRLPAAELCVWWGQRLSLSCVNSMHWQQGSRTRCNACCTAAAAAALAAATAAAMTDELDRLPTMGLKGTSID